MAEAIVTTPPVRRHRVAAAAVTDLVRFSPAFTVGAVLLLVTLVFTLLSAFSPFDPTDRHVVPADLEPSLAHPLGTTSLGQDLFWIMTFAVRNSLVVAGLAVVIGRSIAVVLGSFLGYTGGTVDRVLSSVTDSFIVIPRLPLLILVAAILKGTLSLPALALLIGLLDWAWPSKRYRSQVLTLREETFTQTAAFSGMRPLTVILREHVPFLVPFILADAITGFLYAIGMEITLSILGLTDLAVPTLGTTIYWANYYQALLSGKLWWLIAPVAASILMVVGFYQLSTSLSQYLDPRTRARALAGRAAA